MTCRALGLSQSWFYKWRDRQPTPRQQRRADLAVKIREIFDASGGTYGSPRVTLDLHAAGWQVGENTVARLMAELGLAGRPPKRRRSLTRPGKRPVAPDRVARKFTAPAPDVLWCGDMTEIVTEQGKLYLPVTWNHPLGWLDGSRRYVGAARRVLTGDGAGGEVAGSGSARTGGGVAAGLG
jgi:transposase InsO family protein